MSFTFNTSLHASAARLTSIARGPCLICRSSSSSRDGSGQPSTSGGGSNYESSYSRRQSASYQDVNQDARRSNYSRDGSSGRPDQRPAPSNSPQQQPRRPPKGGDPFASFRHYQQAAMLQAAGVGRSSFEAGMRPDLGWLPGSGESQLQLPLSRGWFARPEYTVETLYTEILARCEEQRCEDGALFMIMKLAQSRDDARTCVDAVSAVRTNRVRQGTVEAFGPRLCALFTKMCLVCDAPDMLAEGLQRSNELGLLLSTNRIHEALMAWGAALELHKIEQVVGAMESGGVLPTTRTAYIMIRAAINCGRQEVAERYATILQKGGVRLHPTTLRLLQLGREQSSLNGRE